MGKHKGKGEATRSGGKHAEYDAQHRSDDKHREKRPDYSGFNVDSPEREARGVGNRQTGGDRSQE